MRRGNPDNLISIGDRTTDKQREITTKGGIRSGEVRRENKRWRDIYNAVGKKKITITNPDGTKETVTFEVAGAMAVYRRYIQEGDPKAAAIIAKILGEMEDKITFDGKVQGITVKVDNPETAEQLQNILNK